MGFAVLHLDKASGNDAAMTAHIERTIEPKNADKNRTHLNRELITFPDDVPNRTEAIQHRIETAGITRKISHNQVRAIRIILSGSPEEMKHIEAAGRLNHWCSDNMEWLKKTFGVDNVVSAVLHLDEKTPHIHATVVPIVTGERRKAKMEKPADGKKKYKKKNTNAARLCADDIMARDKLKSYQDSYAETMGKYGLQRGIEGSEARHITTQQYYRELYCKNESLIESIGNLQEEREEIYGNVREMYDRKDEAQEKFLDMDKHVRDKKEELATVETKLQNAKQDYEPHKAQEELNLIHNLFPMMKEWLRIANFCRKIGFGVEHIRRLLKGNTLTINSGKLFSPEHQQYYQAQNLKMQIEKEPNNPGKLRINVNGMDILEWFRQKHTEFLKKIGVKVNQETRKVKGVKM